jgi:hypothetical protein
MDSALCYFDFTSQDTLIGARYQFIANSGEQVYNGTQAFSSLKEENKVIYIGNPKIIDVKSSIFMLNSIYVLRKVLQNLIIDTSITFVRLDDTIMNNQSCYTFSIKLKNKMIDLMSDSIVDEKSNSNFFLVIS